MSSIFSWLKELFTGEKRPTRIKIRLNMAKQASCWNYDIEAGDTPSGLYVKPGNKIDFPKGQPTSVIEFHLHGQAGQKLDFDLADPIWVKAGSCPTTRCSVPNEITVLPSSTKDRLDVQNRNLQQAEFHYRLNFVDSAGNKHFWDPIIRNGGDGGP